MIKMSTKFEQYLVDNGYIPHIGNKPGYTYYSSLGVIQHWFIHKDDQSDYFSFGLGEYGKPPTLLSPLPVVIYNCDGKIWMWGHTPQDEVERIIQQFGPEEVVRRIKSKEPFYFNKCRE